MKLLLFTRCRNSGLTVLSGFSNRFLRPHTRDNKVSLRLCFRQAHQIHWDSGILTNRPTLQKQDFVIRRDTQQVLQVLQSILITLHESRTAMTHLHHTGTKPLPQKHIFSRGRQDFLRQCRRSRCKIINTMFK